VTGKEKACAEIGIQSFETRFPEDVAEKVLLEKIAECNRDSNVHGILVQLPLPRHMDERRVIRAIDPAKDVDGFTPVNLGRMLLEEPCYIPCTPRGIIELLKRSGVPTNGAHAVVVGRSNIVGKPLENLPSASPSTPLSPYVIQGQRTLQLTSRKRILSSHVRGNQAWFRST
jgi:methylenetetrahydrofolate dehydrogenase (NADP+)/methenyltetrahydrofolate cyclohydrolase